jgi:hypothetical protein
MVLIVAISLDIPPNCTLTEIEFVLFFLIIEYEFVIADP